MIVKGFVRLTKLYKLTDVHIGFIVSTIMLFFITEDNNRNFNKSKQMYYYFDDAPISDKREKLIYIKAMTKKLIYKYKSLSLYFSELFIKHCNQQFAYNRFEMRQYVLYCGYLRINKPNSMPWVIETIICAFFIIYYDLVDVGQFNVHYPCGAVINKLRQRRSTLHNLIYNYIQLQIQHCTSISYLTNRNYGFDFDIGPYQHKLKINDIEYPRNPLLAQMNIINRKIINNEQVNSFDNDLFSNVWELFKLNNPVTTPNFYQNTTSEDNNTDSSEDNNTESFEDNTESFEDNTESFEDENEYIHMILIHGFCRELPDTIISPIAWLIFIYYSQMINDEDNSIELNKQIEWSQSISEVELFLDLDQDIICKHLQVNMKPNHIYVGSNNKLILNDHLKYRINIEESSWFLDQGYKQIKRLWIFLRKESNIWWDNIFSNTNSHYLINEIITEQDIEGFDLEWSFLWCI